MQIDREDFLKFLATKEEVIIGDDEKYVVNFAYSQYVNIKKLTIGKNLKEISNAAFYNCSKLEQIDIPHNKRFFMEGNCLIQRDKKFLALCMGEKRMPDDVEQLEMMCFLQDGEVENFYIGKNLQKIKRSLRKFNIKNIELNPENEYFELEGKCLFYKNSNDIILGCENSVIPERTKRIKAESFINCNIRKVHIPHNVDTIESMAFYNCAELEEVTFDEGVRRIENSAFSRTKIKDVNLPVSIVFVNSEVFSGCKALKSITSMGSVDEITESVFSQCDGLEEVHVDGKINHLRESAFYNCKNLKSVVLGQGVEFLGDHAFAYCVNLNKITMSDTVENMQECIFMNCESLREVKLSNSLTNIPYMAFKGCKSLVEINLPKSIKEIGTEAFSDCINLKYINKVRKVAADAFNNCEQLLKQK